MKRQGSVVLSALCALALACASTPAPPLALSPIAPRVLHHLTTNGIIQLLPGIQLNGAALGASALGPLLKKEPFARKFLKYLVECALPADASVVVAPGGQDLTFHGSIGLAPQWANSTCDEACQQWVSACLLARTNHWGVTVSIYMIGNHPALSGTEGLENSPVEEGAFYGNIFADPPQEYACRGGGYDPLLLNFRQCTQPGNYCGMQYVGSCGEVDGETGQAAQTIACDPRASGDPSFAGCRNRARSVGGKFDTTARSYSRVISVYVHRTGFSPSCGGSPWPSDAPAPPDPFADNLCSGDAPSCAGMTCVNDEGCHDDALTCTSTGPDRAYCTKKCGGFASQSKEMAQCGGEGTTCLTAGSTPGNLALCTKTCDPKAKSGQLGACVDWQACTGFWWTKTDFVPDTAGCTPFCRDDSDCISGNLCNPRVPGCGAPQRPDALPDGFPCSLASATSPQMCRGLCYPMGKDPQKGICGSVINLALTNQCPDDPALMNPLGNPTKDGVGLCLFRDCQSDDDCTAPLICFNTGVAKRCQAQL